MNVPWKGNLGSVLLTSLFIIIHSYLFLSYFPSFQSLSCLKERFVQCCAWCVFFYLKKMREKVTMFDVGPSSHCRFISWCSDTMVQCSSFSACRALYCVHLVHAVLSERPVSLPVSATAGRANYVSPHERIISSLLPLRRIHCSIS